MRLPIYTHHPREALEPDAADGQVRVVSVAAADDSHHERIRVLVALALDGRHSEGQQCGKGSGSVSRGLRRWRSSSLRIVGGRRLPGK